MEHYYVIDLKASERLGRPALYIDRSLNRSTARLSRAMKLLVDEANCALARYDNGSTAQVILCDLIDLLAHNETTHAIPYRHLMSMIRNSRTTEQKETAA